MEKEDLKGIEIILIGGSAGSLEVIFKLVSALGDHCSIPVVLIIHRLKTSDGGLSKILSQKTKLSVREPFDKEVIRPGTIYLAPPDYHLLIETDRTFSLDFSEKVNFSRPSIDPTFETAAECFKATAVAILLSGASADGVEGLKAIKKAGGTVVIQDPDSAQTPYMPEQALEVLRPDHILSGDQIAELVSRISCGHH